MDKTSLGDRMKENYERVYNIKLPRRMPVIMRIDGNCFKKLTKKCDRPFDLKFIDTMDQTTIFLCERIQGVQMAYVQSDEISLLLHNYKKLISDAWFGNEIQKMVSIAAGMASAIFTEILGKPAYFDARVFIMPEDEVCNYFLWREQDWERNSIQMLARSLYSHKECNRKNQKDLQEMCWQKGENWNNLSIPLKRGRCIIQEQYKHKGGEVLRKRWIVDQEIPIFKKDREYIEKFLKVEQ